LRQLHSERAGEAIVGPVVIVLLPIGLNRDDTAELCGSSKLCRHKVRWIATTQ
jgi:hypothetical protein